MRHRHKELEGLQLFGGNAHPVLARNIAAYLGVPLSESLITQFLDGETRVEIMDNARGQQIYVVQPTCYPTNDNLMELCIMLEALRRADAEKLTAVIPYFGYARQDKKVKPREPITAKMVAGFLEQAGADRVITLDLHSDPVVGFFNVPVDNMPAGPLLGRHIQKVLDHVSLEDVVAVSPDVGGSARAVNLAKFLGCSFAIIQKSRPRPNVVEIMEIIGNVKDKWCVIIDDMIDTGNTIIQGANALLAKGAKGVYVICTHGVLSGPATERLQASAIERIICLDTIPIPEEKRVPKLEVLSCAEWIGEAIRRQYLKHSVSELFADWRKA